MAAHAYLTVFTGTTQGVYKVDVGLGTVTRIANLAAPRGLCVTPDELYAYVAGVSSAVQKIDTTTGATLVTIATPLPAFELDISFDGAYVYALCPGGPLYVIATATDTIVATISAAAPSAVRAAHLGQRTSRPGSVARSGHRRIAVWRRRVPRVRAA